VPGLILVSGFMGHGFMMAPAVGKRLAQLLATGVTPEPFGAWAHRRFRLRNGNGGTAAGAREQATSEAMIIG
jgi:glycine/D-amino acid oxidase-like deaminating enzyme